MMKKNQTDKKFRKWNRVFRYLAALMLLSALSVLIACGKKPTQSQEGRSYLIYEVNSDETKIAGREFDGGESTGDILIERLLDEMMKVDEHVEMRPAIAPGITLKGYQVQDETITLDFDQDYYKQSVTGEVLSRAAIVRTLSQVDSVSYVQFTIGGVPLSNRSGVPVGVMTAGQFIDNSGKELETQEQVVLTLYFASADGESLKKLTRKVVYSSNSSLDKLVMEQLIGGVSEEEEEKEEIYSTINPDTKLLSVKVSDGVCYVNFDEAFLTQTQENSALVTIYSIVNSLAELPGVNKVQILVNGSSEQFFTESIPLSQPFERNLEIVTE